MFADVSSRHPPCHAACQCQGWPWCESLPHPACQSWFHPPFHPPAQSCAQPPSFQSTDSPPCGLTAWVEGCAASLRASALSRPSVPSLFDGIDAVCRGTGASRLSGLFLFDEDGAVCSGAGVSRISGALISDDVDGAVCSDGGVARSFTASFVDDSGAVCDNAKLSRRCTLPRRDGALSNSPTPAAAGGAADDACARSGGLNGGGFAGRLLDDLLGRRGRGAEGGPNACAGCSHLGDFGGTVCRDATCAARLHSFFSRC